MAAGVDAAMLVAVGLGLVGMLAALVAAVRARRDHPLSPASVALGAAGLAASAALAVLLPPVELKPLILAALVVGGAAAGVLAGARVGMRCDARRAIVRGGGWHTLPAGVALVGLQGASVTRSLDGVAAATSALVATAAFAGAAGVLVLARGAWTLARSRNPTASPDVAAAAGHAAPAAPARARSAVEAAPSPEAVAAAAGVSRVTVRSSCGRCGAPVAVGWRHCVTCGAALAWES